MEFRHSADRIEVRPTIPEQTLLRYSVDLRLLKASSGGLPLPHFGSSVLLWYHSKDSVEPFNFSVNLRQLEFFHEALSHVLPDLTAENMKVASEIIKSMEAEALESEARSIVNQAPDLTPEQFFS